MQAWRAREWSWLASVTLSNTNPNHNEVEVEKPFFIYFFQSRYAVDTCRTFRTIDYSYHIRSVPLMDFSYRSYGGLFVVGILLVSMLLKGVSNVAIIVVHPSTPLDLLFTVRCYAKLGYATVLYNVCLSVRP